MCLKAYSWYINKTAQNEQFLSKHGVRLQRESGGLPERHLCYGEWADCSITLIGAFIKRTITFAD